MATLNRLGARRSPSSPPSDAPSPPLPLAPPPLLQVAVVAEVATPARGCAFSAAIARLTSSGRATTVLTTITWSETHRG